MTQLDLVIPGLCGPLPEVDRLDSPAVKSLVSWLAKADKKILPQQNFYDVLVTLFGLSNDTSLPAAALSLLASDQYTAQGHWFRADPVHLQADMDHAILRDSHGLDLTFEESETLLEELNTHFREDGIRFLMHDKDSWFLNVSDHEKVSTTAVHDVISRNVYAFMPQGEDALYWKKFMNEVQMLLHQSPVNEKRIERNKLPVNGAWLWGEGALPKKTASQRMTVHGSHSIVMGLAILNGIDCQPVTSADAFLENFSNESENLLVLDDLFAVTCYGDVMEWQTGFNDLYEHWLEPILNWAMKNKVKVNLYPCNGVCYQISRSNKFRFFRDKKIESYIKTYE